MIIKGYGVTLSRLTREDIETVRGWRNAEHIRQFMEYREYITPEMQEKWFESVDNESNNYYIIHEGDEKVGLIYGANIDWEKMETGNGGIFIGKDSFWNTNLPIAATILLMEISFMLGLNKTYIKVMRNNARAINFNKTFGYRLMPDQENEMNQKYFLTPENYESSIGRIKKMIEKVYSNKIEITINNPAHRVSQMAMDEYKKRYDQVKDRVTLRVI